MYSIHIDVIDVKNPVDLTNKDPKVRPYTNLRWQFGMVGFTVVIGTERSIVHRYAFNSDCAKPKSFPVSLETLLFFLCRGR